MTDALPDKSAAVSVMRFTAFRCPSCSRARTTFVSKGYFWSKLRCECGHKFLVRYGLWA